MKLIDVENQLNEMVTTGSGQIARVVRNKEVVRRRICPPGKKLVDGKCQTMSTSEKVKRKRTAVKANKKGKRKRVKSQKKSMKLRRLRGL